MDEKTTVKERNIRSDIRLGDVFECIEAFNYVEVGSQWFISEIRECRRRDFVLLPYNEFGQKRKYNNHHDPIHISEGILIENFKKADFREDGLNDGLDAAWETVRKICRMPDAKLEKIFGTPHIDRIIGGHTPREAISKLEEYEKSRIQVGDIVKCNTISAAVVLKIYENEEKADLYSAKGGAFEKVSLNILEKIGEAKTELETLSAKLKGSL